MRGSGGGRAGRAEDGFEAGGEAAPVLELRAERATPGGGQAVVARPPIVVGGAPLARDQPLLLQPLERGVEGALVDLEHPVGDLLHALADAPAVHRLERERLEDEQVERATEGVALRADGHERLGAGVPVAVWRKVSLIPVDVKRKPVREVRGEHERAASTAPDREV
jgi:hypothetical protein